MGSRPRHLHRLRLGERLQRVVIESRDWLDVVNFYDSPEAFFFFDPPYVNCADTAYAAFTPVQMGEIRERLDTMSGTWLLTCDDSAACREIFAGLPAQRLTIKYALGNKSAAGKNAAATGTARRTGDDNTGGIDVAALKSKPGAKTPGGVKESGELLIFHPGLAPAGVEKLPARERSAKTVDFNAAATSKKRSLKIA